MLKFNKSVPCKNAHQQQPAGDILVIMNPQQTPQNPQQPVPQPIAPPATQAPQMPQQQPIAPNPPVAQYQQQPMQQQAIVMPVAQAAPMQASTPMGPFRYLPPKKAPILGGTEVMITFDGENITLFNTSGQAVDSVQASNIEKYVSAFGMNHFVTKDNRRIIFYTLNIHPLITQILSGLASVYFARKKNRETGLDTIFQNLDARGIPHRIF